MNEPNLIRKDTLTDKVINKQKRILIIAVLCVLTLFIGSSYALLTNFDKTDNVINFTTGNLNITVTNSGDSLTLTELNGKLPETDQTGLQNATPIVLTLTNTGTMNIMRYDVKLTSDATKTSTLDEKYIKYAISLDNGTTYSSPSILTENDNIIYTGYNLDVDASKIVYLKLWIDENAGNYALNKEYYGSITVDLYQKSDIPGSVTMMNAITANTDASCNPSVTDTDGTIYFSGDNTCVDFNYVWYSGKLWRITAIYPDGTMKMITDSNITTIAYGANNKFYTDENTTSYMYQWLNQEFLPTLYNYENIIVEDAVWNASPGNETISSKLPIEGQEEVLVNASVGLLNSYEYYKSYQNTSYSNGYLNIGYTWWLLNPYSASSSYVWYVNNNGSGSNGSPSGANGVRPSIYLKSEVQLIGGTGTESNPYRIKKDQEQAEANVTLINTRQSGEYVNFDGKLYRIVGIENEATKLIKDDYVKDESSTILTKAVASSTTFGSSIETGSDDYWDYYLNKTWKPAIEDDYEKMLVEGTYYIQSYKGGNYNYKNTACATVSNATSIKDCDKTGVSTWTGYVGLPRYGEMFASQTRDYTYSNAKNMWLITPSATTNFLYMYSIRKYGDGAAKGPSSAYGGRPTINLKSEILIESGSGIKSDPYEIKLVETTETEEVQE